MLWTPFRVRPVVVRTCSAACATSTRRNSPASWSVDPSRRRRSLTRLSLMERGRREPQSRAATPPHPVLEHGNSSPRATDAPTGRTFGAASPIETRSGMSSDYNHLDLPHPRLNTERHDVYQKQIFVSTTHLCHKIIISPPFRRGIEIGSGHQKFCFLPYREDWRPFCPPYPLERQSD